MRTQNLIWPQRLDGLWRLLSCLLIWVLAGVVPARAQDFLPAEQAFRVQASVASPQAVQLDFMLAPQTYLYRERMQAQWGDHPLPMVLPDGERKMDPTFNKVMEVYHRDLSATVNIPAPATPVAGEQTLTVSYQGCADAGLCYPPQTRRFRVTLGPQGQVQAVAALWQGMGERSASLLGGGVSQAPGGSAAAADGAGADRQDDRITAALASGRWLTVVGVFLLAGVLLSLTPCVLPMVPILSSIIVGHGQQVSRGRGLALALSYSQGMALVYTGLGVAAGMLGQGLAAYLQHPWVVLSFAAVMVLLALSMFGLYELRLPVGVQSWLGHHTQGLPGGRFVSVFVMGAVSALIVSPCVSAPLAGALLYISQSRDVVLGGAALYAMAWGMSVPLLLVGLSAGSLLPKAGPWMTAVKGLFGVLMLGMAVWVARPAWPVLVAAVQGQSVSPAGHQSVLPFQRVRSVTELEAAVREAARQGRPVMLDFYADWCVSCLEMERETFTDTNVRARLAQAVLLQADVTANNADDRALLARFKLFGPPGIIFFDRTGQELTGVRVIGFQKPAEFSKALEAAGLR
ncbi:MAG TPA: protein-disulfide reductase DsbD [Aquabacterium sp.]|uniref:protein-disulfide reductase DsbD n=1 Tax=Aquabacterium sp. TaxID=1872578 RepID=UPI002E2F2E27|nr:protein-disulfide reductase DsbD [Aquabacterium sp.]HEX5371664.1 protein-disulfide reductase DsbD [Aquabacterium sp.]